MKIELNRSFGIQKLDADHLFDYAFGSRNDREDRTADTAR